MKRGIVNITPSGGSSCGGNGEVKGSCDYGAGTGSGHSVGVGLGVGSSGWVWLLRDTHEPEEVLNKVIADFGEDIRIE